MSEEDQILSYELMYNFMSCDDSYFDLLAQAIFGSKDESIRLLAIDRCVPQFNAKLNQAISAAGEWPFDELETVTVLYRCIPFARLPVASNYLREWREHGSLGWQLSALLTVVSLGKGKQTDEPLFKRVIAEAPDWVISMEPNPEESVMSYDMRSPERVLEYVKRYAPELAEYLNL